MAIAAFLAGVIRWLQRGTEAGEHGGIDLVGLEPRAGGLGEAAGLPGVDLDGGETGLTEYLFQRAVIRAGGLEHDARWLPRLDPGDQGGKTQCAIVETSTDVVGQQVSIESVLADVDADGDAASGRC